MNPTVARSVSAGFRLALLAVAGLSLVGCTVMNAVEENQGEKGFATTRVVKAPTKSPSAYHRIGLWVESQPAGSEAEVGQYLSQLRSGLEQAGVFESVAEVSGDPGNSVDLVADLTVVEVKKVTSSDRTWKGAMAGPAIFGVSLVLSEPGSDQALGGAAIVGSTASKSIYSGTTEDAVRAAADATRRFLLEY